MGPEVVNRNKGCEFHGPYAGRDLHITMLQESEREFVVTHNVNIKPVSYFTGRGRELQELRQRIEEGRKSVLVSGMGGIGKTHICRKLFEEYLNRHARDENGTFHHIGYIEYNGDMSGSLQNGLKFKGQDSPEKNREAAWKELEYLASEGKLLLFVDNVDRTLNADPGLQRLKGIPGAVVLTSRQMSISDEFEPYRIGFLDMEQCREIYEKIRYEDSRGKIGPEEIRELEYIIENLAGRHTITVELLAHLARTKIWTVKRLREELGQKGFRLAFHKNGELLNIQESYEKLYDLSELTEAEKNILEAFSVFPYIPLAAETCNEWLLADAGVTEEDDILMQLYQKGWLQFDMEQEGDSLHPVFAQFIYEKCRPESVAHHGLIKSCQKALEIVEDSPALEQRNYIPFAERILEKMDLGKSKLQADFLYGFGVLLWYVAEHKKAELVLEKCMEIYQEIFGEEHPDTARSYNSLAKEYFIHGKHAEAEQLYIKCLQIREKLLGEEHLDTAGTCNDLADLYDYQQKYGEAEKLYEKSMRIREKLLGEVHPDTNEVYEKLANMYSCQQKYGEAEELYKKSIRAREKMPGELNLSMALCHRVQLALLCCQQKRYKEAEELYIENLQIREKMSEWERIGDVLEYMGLSRVYEEQEEFEKALNCVFISYKISSFEKAKPLATSAIYDIMEKLFVKWKPDGDFEQWLDEGVKEW